MDGTNVSNSPPDTIDKHVEEAHSQVERGKTQLGTAAKYKVGGHRATSDALSSLAASVPEPGTEARVWEAVVVFEPSVDSESDIQMKFRSP